MRLLFKSITYLELCNNADSLRQLIVSLKTGELSALSPERQYQISRRQFQQTLLRARLGDTDAIRLLQQQATTLLEASRSMFASGPQFAKDFEFVIGSLESVLGVVERRRNIAEEQLNVLQQIEHNTRPSVTSSHNSDSQFGAGPVIGSSTTSNYSSGSQFSVGPVIGQSNEAARLLGRTVEFEGRRFSIGADGRITNSAGKYIGAFRLTPGGGGEVYGVEGQLLGPVDASGGSLTFNGQPVRLLAGGGRVSAGEVAIVGEEGPELVQFGAPGVVLPNKQSTVPAEQLRTIAELLKAQLRQERTGNEDVLRRLEAIERRLAQIDNRARLERQTAA